MKELSLHILDIAENSAKAGAGLIGISITEKGGILTLRITDDGCGMKPEMLSRVTDPFTTSRTTRKVGLGLPLGDVISTIVTLIQGHPDSDLLFCHTAENLAVSLDTRELREVLGDVPLSTPDVLVWIKDSLSEQYGDGGGSSVFVR